MALSFLHLNMRGISSLAAALLVLASPVLSFTVAPGVVKTMAPTLTTCMISPLDAMNEEIGKQKREEDDEVPMTKAEMRQAEKEMRAEMKRLKEEAAAAKKKEE